MAEQVPEKNIILNNGCCPIHARITAEHVHAEMDKHPEAKILAHPECDGKILALADYVGSTSDIITYAKKSDALDFIICTETGVDYQLLSDNPEKRFYYPNPLPCCRDMKKNTVEAVLDVLEKEDKEIIVEEEICRKAILPLEKMLEYAR